MREILVYVELIAYEAEAGYAGGWSNACGFAARRVSPCWGILSIKGSHIYTLEAIKVQRIQ